MFKTSLIVFLLIASPLFADTLNLVTSLDPLEAREYIAAFERDTGVNVRWIRLSAGEALARVRSEAGNPTQCVWFGAPAAEFVAAKEAGILAQYRPDGAIPSHWRDPEGYWTGIYFGAIAFISRGEPPGSWQDLLNPIYKDEIVVSYPYTAGTGFTIYAGLVSLMGEEGALEYYKKLDRQLQRYTKSGSAPIIEIGLGEAGVGIVFDQDALRKGRRFGLNLAYPSDGVPYEIGGVAMIKGCRDESAARKFIDWIISLPAQDMMHKWYRVPLHPKASVAEGSKRPSELNLIKMDFVALGKRRGELIKRWREEVGK